MNVHAVPIGEIIASDVPEDVLVAYGLGSCVAICLYDPVAQVGGMLHALLPAAPNERNPAVRDSRPTKFVKQGTPLLIQSVLSLGAKRSRLQARLCGGARVLSAPGFQDSLNIGDRNVQAAEAALEAAGIRIYAREIGGKIGRTVKLYIGDGQVTVRSLGKGEQTIRE